MSTRTSRKTKLSYNIPNNEDALPKSNRKKQKQLPKNDKLEEIVQDLAKYIAEQDNTKDKANTLLHEEAAVLNIVTSSNDQELAPGKRKAVFATETDSKRQKTDNDCSPARDTFVVEQTATVKYAINTSELANVISLFHEEKEINDSLCAPLDYQALSSVNDISPDILYESYWIPDLNLTTRHKIMVQTPGHALPCEIVDAAQCLLKQQFATEGLQLSSTSWMGLQPVSGRAVQIHSDIDAKHCFTSCYRHNGVEIAETQPLYISPSICMQIEEMYQHVVPDPLRSIKYIQVDRPPVGSNDCVIYAIAFAYELLSNGNIHCRFDNAKMREHLINCFENGWITEFPKISY
ncbi:hypothetical protein XELAEV_18011712mg [Xenopus laevis]|uniref:Ubiquitin-like protease family profile domain-containing protein n=1 Tax=Xenopus laevis TaxID=8355 RepID=A0A974DLD3_XENLA|nr:hypothetical protein XELAEV_18011712mg [Xenopus laevis]